MKKVDEVQAKFQKVMFKVRGDLILIDTENDKISFSEYSQKN